MKLSKINWQCKIECKECDEKKEKKRFSNDITNTDFRAPSLARFEGPIEFEYSHGIEK